MSDTLEKIHPRSLRCLTILLQDRLREHLWLKIMFAMVLGVGIGVVLSPSTGLVPNWLGQAVGEWVALPGQLFLTVIQMIVIPLVFASVIRGIAASEDMEHLKKIGSRVVLYFIFTTTVAIIIGLAIAFFVQPGNYIDMSFVDANIGQGMEPGELEMMDMSIPEMIVGIIPNNPLSAMVESQMLQVVMFAIIFGLALVTLVPHESKPLLDLLGSVQEVCMKIVQWAMKLAPLAVFGLLAQITIKVGLDALLGMGVYVLTVLGGLIILLSFYLLIIYFVGGISPLRFSRGVREVQLLAFSASSSAAVMPLSIETAEDQLGVRPSISQFIIPLGTSINMDGTALYQAVATVFLAQVFNVELGISALVLVVLTTVGASIGSPATPGVGIVILATVLSSVGIPTAGIALILGVDRILDMSRTLVNVTGDLTASVVMDRWVGGKKSAQEQQLEEQEYERMRLESGTDVIVG